MLIFDTIHQQPPLSLYLQECKSQDCICVHFSLGFYILVEVRQLSGCWRCHGRINKTHFKNHTHSADSTAEDYANRYGRTFVALDVETTTTTTDASRPTTTITTITTKQTTAITLTDNPSSFEWGADNWDFLNSRTYFTHSDYYLIPQNSKRRSKSQEGFNPAITSSESKAEFTSVNSEMTGNKDKIINYCTNPAAFDSTVTNGHIIFLH